MHTLHHSTYVCTVERAIRIFSTIHTQTCGRPFADCATTHYSTQQEKTWTLYRSTRTVYTIITIRCIKTRLNPSCLRGYRENSGNSQESQTHTVCATEHVYRGRAAKWLHLHTSRGNADHSNVQCRFTTYNIHAHTHACTYNIIHIYTQVYT